jgi:hypothetical protein
MCRFQAVGPRSPHSLEPAVLQRLTRGLSSHMWQPFLCEPADHIIFNTQDMPCLVIFACRSLFSIASGRPLHRGRGVNLQRSLSCWNCPGTDCRNF